MCPLRIVPLGYEIPAPLYVSTLVAAMRTHSQHLIGTLCGKYKAQLHCDAWGVFLYEPPCFDINATGMAIFWRSVIFNYWHLLFPAPFSLMQVVRNFRELPKCCRLPDPLPKSVIVISSGTWLEGESACWGE